MNYRTMSEGPGHFQTREYVANRLRHIPLRPRLVILEAAEVTRVPVELIIGFSRVPKVVEARHLCWRAMRLLPGPGGRPWSFPAIGSWFGRDHTTVIYAVNGSVEKRRKARETWSPEQKRAELDRLREARLKASDERRREIAEKHRIAKRIGRLLREVA